MSLNDLKILWINIVRMIRSSRKSTKFQKKNKINNIYLRVSYDAPDLTTFLYDTIEYKSIIYLFVKLDNFDVMSTHDICIRLTTLKCTPVAEKNNRKP